MLVSATFGANSSNRFSDAALDKLLNVFKKFEAWQFNPAAFSSMSIKKPSSHRRQVSNKHAEAVCCSAMLRIRGVKRNSCSNELAYELAMCVSSPE